MPSVPVPQDEFVERQLKEAEVHGLRGVSVGGQGGWQGGQVWLGWRVAGRRLRRG